MCNDCRSRFASRRIALPLLLTVAGIHSLGTSDAALAQRRALAIKNTTVFTGDGRALDGVTLIVSGGKFEAIGRKVKAPLFAKKISGRGKYVTPGLIDAWSTLGMRLAETGVSPTARAEDAFDRFAEYDIRAALAQGVTAILAPAPVRSGLGGLCAILRLKPGAALDDILVSGEVALCAAHGVDPTKGPLARVKALGELRKQWQAARDYREALEQYAEDLEEYEKKIKERAEKEAEGGKDEKKGAETKPAGPSKKKIGPGGGKRRRGEKPGVDEGTAGDAADVTDERSAERRPRGRRRGRGERPNGDDAADKKDKDKKDGIKKPKEPKKNRGHEVLLRVIDGELPWIVEAHRPQDILNILEVAAEFELRLILNGASGAHHVAEKLAEAEVPVILGPSRESMRFDRGPRRYDAVDAADVLRAAGVEVYLASTDGDMTRHLALSAAARVSAEFDSDAVLSTITSRAAALFGLEDRLGRIARGMEADFVIWSGHPFSPGARAERVFIAGQEVYNADEERN